MTVLACQWSNLPLGHYARRWLNVVKPQVSRHVAAVDSGGMEQDFNGLPLDYYAPGVGYSYAKTSWGRAGTALQLQLGMPVGVWHRHLDAGTFQLWRNGQWLSKEFTGYSESIQGYDGEAEDASRTVAHNGILFGGIGLVNAYADGPPKVLRLESAAQYFFAAVDLSAMYRAHGSSHRDRDDNPYAGTAIREFVFVKPLETVVILDRLRSVSDVLPGDTVHRPDSPNNVAKTFLIHFPQQPIVFANRVTETNGAQVLEATTLIPSSATYKVIDESQFAGAKARSNYYQYRVEVETRGQAESYFLHVLQARDAAGGSLTSQVSEGVGSFTLTLQHGSLGSAKIVFNKGMVSSGGTFGYSASAVPATLTPLLRGVQGIQVTDSGPAWEVIVPGLDRRAPVHPH
jgi:hypothetical protein